MPLFAGKIAHGNTSPHRPRQHIRCSELHDGRRHHPNLHHHRQRCELDMINALQTALARPKGTPKLRRVRTGARSIPHRLVRFVCRRFLQTSSGPHEPCLKPNTPNRTQHRAVQSWRCPQALMASMQAVEPESAILPRLFTSSSPESELSNHGDETSRDCSRARPASAPCRPRPPPLPAATRRRRTSPPPTGTTTLPLSGI